MLSIPERRNFDINPLMYELKYASKKILLSLTTSPLADRDRSTLFSILFNDRGKGSTLL